MTFLGIWSCQWRELRPISFGGNSGIATNSGEFDTENINPEDVVYGRGRGRGKGRDGGGEYEMVGLKESPNGNV